MLAWNEKQGYKLNKYIKATIEKQKRIHKTYIYRYDRVEQYIDFVENNFMLTKGDLRYINLFPTQKWWIELMLGYDRINDKGQQVQLTNEIFLNVGRGTGKSSLMATRELYWLLWSGVYGGESQVIAYDNKQARQVYDQVRIQSQASPYFAKLSEAKIFKSTKIGLEYTVNQNKFFKQTNDVNRAQGGDTSLNIFDEVHTYKDDITEAVNKGSRQKQANWQSIYITSGGLTRNGLYDKMIERFTSKEEMDNDRSFGLLYKLENIEQVKDKSYWSMAMPLIGHVPSYESVEEEYNLSQGDPALQTKFLAYNMGVQMNDVTYYFDQKNAVRSEFDEYVFDDNKVYVGIDLSLVGDLTAVSFLCEKEGVKYSKTISFMVKRQFENLDNEMKERYETFVDEGSLIVLDSEYIKGSGIIPEVQRFKDIHHCQFKKIGYDPSRYEELKELIDRYFFDVDGDNQKAIRQGFSMSDYIKLFKMNIDERQLVHNQKLLEWSLMNVAVKIGISKDIMYTKMLDKDKIDPVVALTMALEVMVLDET
ncbi:terminase subunit [Lactococcus fujiensis JCM 16395]|uniref:Terminase subunit n=2 Tax=Lactococcus fujiensis TaxID=610251 RepID=A0A2A5RIC7_9LACT|nr:terminase subunit [Lactococcus fujiensis JCM 16395]